MSVTASCPSFSPLNENQDGVNIDYLIVRVQTDIVDKLIHQEQLESLWAALQSLPEDERSLIDELFFNEQSERKLASELGVPRMTLSDKKHRILGKLKKLMDK